MLFLQILIPILIATVLSIAGWLIKRNEDQHEELGKKVEDVRIEVVKTSSKLDILLEDRKEDRRPRKWLK